jgi:hypothetical protein
MPTPAVVLTAHPDYFASSIPALIVNKYSNISKEAQK